MSESPQTSLTRDAAVTPGPEDQRKPDSPTDIKGPTWRFVLVKVWREFSDDQCTDLAAALTYYAVLAIFPAAVALFALLGVVSNPQQAVQTVVDVLSPLVSSQTLGTIQPALEGIASSQTAGLALVLGVVGALWSASGYVGAFSRAMNRIYEIHEGRPFWKLRPLMLLITLRHLMTHHHAVSELSVRKFALVERSVACLRSAFVFWLLLLLRIAFAG